MEQQIINNGESGLSVRNKINGMFANLISGSEGVNAIWKQIGINLNYTAEIGNVETLNATSKAWAEIYITGKKFIFNFGIPQGYNGGMIIIRKTYSSVAEMNADKNPTGDDGLIIDGGQIVSVFNPSNPDENAFYSRTADGWKMQLGVVKEFRDEMKSQVNSVKQEADKSKTDIQSLVNALPVTQQTGDSTTSVMSQKAVTDALGNAGKLETADSTTGADLDVTDENGNVLLQAYAGHLRGKNFDTYKTSKSIEDIDARVQSIEETNTAKTVVEDIELPTYDGDVLQIFKYPLLLNPAYYSLNINIWVNNYYAYNQAQGKNLERYFEYIFKSNSFTPTDKKLDIGVTIYDNLPKRIDKSTFSIKAYTPTNPSSMKNILLIGDSETEGVVNNVSSVSASNPTESSSKRSPYSNEVKALLTTTRTASTGVPKGLGLTNFQLIGSRNTTGGRHEGYGGKTSAWFMGTSSPFYKGSKIDFNAYLTQDNIYDDTTHKGVDIIYILLGANDGVTAVTDSDGYVKFKADDYNTGIRALLDAIKSQLIDGTGTYANQSLQVVLLSYASPYIAGGGYMAFGSKDMDSGIFPALKFKYLYELNKEICAEDNYKDFVSAIYPALEIDSENGYNSISKPKNNYSEETENVIIESVHPNTMAYKQYGAAVVRDIISRFQ